VRYVSHHKVEFNDPRSLNLRHLEGTTRVTTYASQVGNGITLQLIQPGKGGEQCQVTMKPEIALLVIDALHAAIRDNVEIPHEGSSGLW
jgi:hypothetical protein